MTETTGVYFENPKDWEEMRELLRERQAVLQARPEQENLTRPQYNRRLSEWNSRIELINQAIGDLDLKKGRALTGKTATA